MDGDRDNTRDKALILPMSGCFGGLFLFLFLFSFIAQGSELGLLLASSSGRFRELYGKPGLEPGKVSILHAILSLGP